MASDPRRFDAITKVVSDQRRQLDDIASTVLSRLSSHTHFGASIPVVASTATITAPFTGQVIFNTTDNMLYRYDGAAWVAFAATGGGTAATTHEARYEQHTTQAFGTSTDTKIVWDTIITNTNDVVVSGGSTCALGRAGLWRISAGVRYQGAAGGGERHIFLQTGTVFAVANRIASSTAVNVGTVPCTVSTSTDFRAAAGSSVFAAGWQNSGGTLSTDIGFGGTNHISLTWLRP